VQRRCGDRIGAVSKTLLVALAVVVLVPSAAAGTQSRLRVLAATSLAGVLPSIEPNANYTFAGSSKLAARIEAGGSADVFVSANVSDPAALHAKGLVSAPVVFAHNSVVVIVPAANRARIRSLADLKRTGVRVEIADETVSLGGYTLQVLKAMHLSAVLANVAGRDDDVRTVVAKVVAGKVDAGFVYASDAHALGSRVHVIPVPQRAQPNVAYAAAVVASSASRSAAAAFVAALRSPRAQAALRGAGFR
jgi:molybdate transport system substrate-binding protein